MDILVAFPEGDLRDDFFSPSLYKRLESLGDVTWNPTAEAFSESDLCERIGGIDVLVTGWPSPQVTADVVRQANDLELIAHTGGSVAGVASSAVYDEGICVTSANDVMATHVAEHVLGGIIAHRRAIPELDARMKQGRYDTEGLEFRSLHGTTIGLIGLGTIGRNLLEHLSSFDVTVSVYDPYVDESTVAAFESVELTDIETALDSEIVSVHAARTPETIGLLDADRLSLIPDGALFVNTARADLVVEEPLLAELRSGRISGFFDVYYEEPLPEDHELRTLENVLLSPHVGGSQIRTPLTAAVLDEIERFQSGSPLEHEIPRSQWEHMSHV